MKSPTDIDAYIRACAPPVRAILQRIRATIAAAAPDARETISYRMPTFVRRRVLVHFAAFQQHIGLFPPVRGDAALLRAVQRYAGPKGNLRFPLAAPMPYALIARIVKLRVRQEDAAAKATPVKPARKKKVAATRRGRAVARRVRKRPP